MRIVEDDIFILLTVMNENLSFQFFKKLQKLDKIDWNEWLVLYSKYF